MLHREDGPAVDRPGKYQAWFINGFYHREDGPAVEYVNGDKYWWLNGERHRKDGPAVELADGKYRYYLEGHLIPNKEFEDKEFQEQNPELYNDYLIRNIMND
jgi:hypothetical protein